ncbi:IgGFc-binding protein-like [Syngnathus scovelli]|uniref:IgGFc-binding protein-like n=1 Tax=Syngnathus scovelli TaxID=161590 RepID=UPI002110D320|nr:IgGFc-binding protein-like [Syngnathus scovelli]
MPCKYPALTDKRTCISVRVAQTTRLKRRMLAKGHLYFAVLLFLLKRATETRCTSGSNFLVVFPENIAYFYPEEPHNQLHVTALHDNTKVTVAIRQQTHTEILVKAQTRRFFSYGTTELGRENVSDKVLRVSSTRQVTVQVVSVKAGSVQSARVLPVDALGTEYLVPRVPENQNTTQPPDVVCAYMTEFAPFRLIVVNAEKVNTVSLEGDNITKEVELEPHHAAQFWLGGNEVWRVVRAKHPVAVLFGHPCAATLNCGCSMLYVTLNPKPHGKMAFLVPPLLSQASEDQTALLLSQEDASSVDSSYPGWPLLELSGIAVLHRPGLLLPLIPQSELASCYVVNAIPDVYNFAVILVHKDLATGVRVGSSPLEDPTWLTLTGTDYVSTVVTLSLDSAIWHTSDKMAVYYIGQKGGVLFGNPAPAISQTSDYRGCVLSPDVWEIGSEALGWQESIKFCRDRNLRLVSLSSLQLMEQVQVRVRQGYTGDSVPRRAWIGLRRSTLTGAWYWIDRAPFTVSNWQGGKPEDTHGGHCGTINLEPSQDFGWSHEDCCQDVHPICYREPQLFTTQ